MLIQPLQVTDSNLHSNEPYCLFSLKSEVIHSKQNAIVPTNFIKVHSSINFVKVINVQLNSMIGRF